MNKTIKITGEANPVYRDELGILPSSATFGKNQVEKIIVEEGEMRVYYKNEGKIAELNISVDKMYKTTLEFF